MVALVVAPEVHERVDAGGERAVEPAPALPDELGGRLGHVRLALGRLDVAEDPPLVGLGDELEAEDAVLGEEHVCGRRSDRQSRGLQALDEMEDDALLVQMLMPSVPLGPRRAASVPSPWKYWLSGRPWIALKRYAEKAPGRTAT